MQKFKTLFAIGFIILALGMILKAPQQPSLYTMSQTTLNTPHPNRMASDSLKAEDLDKLNTAVACLQLGMSLKTLSPLVLESRRYKNLCGKA